LLYAGQKPKWDVSKVRPKGARLKTFGGRASGPQPLVDLFVHTTQLFEQAAGRKLNSLECHGLMCKIAEVIVVGSVRRSALISLSNLTDQRMRTAKSGQWWDRHPEFSLANNSVAYTEKPDIGIFMEEWKALYDSKSGERGIFNRDGLKRKIRAGGVRDPEHEFLTNPCSEISLRSCGLCNLSEVVVRPSDTWEDLQRKARLAAILGTIQSTFTEFRYVRSAWKKNADEERLLGVSLTGIYDHAQLSGQGAAGTMLGTRLAMLQAEVVETNKTWATRLGINPSVSVTCVKPSGTVSCLVDSASGIHPRHGAYYIRSVRQDNKDPVTQLLKDQGVPWEPCVSRPDSTTVFFFPMKSPEGAVLRDDVTALQHLELWSAYNSCWATHQVSITCSLRDDEWLDVGAWVYKHFDDITGISFLPFSGGTYKQMPYDVCTKERYEDALAKMPPNIDWSRLREYEMEDQTTGVQMLSCSSGVCEI
jgi:ribonucleoside-triphosphate reductase